MERTIGMPIIILGLSLVSFSKSLQIRTKWNENELFLNNKFIWIGLYTFALLSIYCGFETKWYKGLLYFVIVYFVGSMLSGFIARIFEKYLKIVCSICIPIISIIVLVIMYQLGI